MTAGMMRVVTVRPAEGDAQDDLASQLALLAAAAFAACLQSRTRRPPAQMPSTALPGTTCTPEHAAMGHCTLPAKQAPQPAAAGAAERSRPACPKHAAMGHCTPPSTQPAAAAPAARAASAADLPAGACRDGALHARRTAPRTPQPMPPAAIHLLAGACGDGPLHAPAPQPATQADMPAGACGMGHCTSPARRLPRARTCRPATRRLRPCPTDYAADAIYGPSAMAMGRHHLRCIHGGQKLLQVMLNIAEAQIRKGRDGYEWDGEAWYGGDINRLVGQDRRRRRVRRWRRNRRGPGALQPRHRTLLQPPGGVRYDFKPEPVAGLRHRRLRRAGAELLRCRGRAVPVEQGRADGPRSRAITTSASPSG